MWTFSGCRRLLTASGLQVIHEQAVAIMQLYVLFAFTLQRSIIALQRVVMPLFALVLFYMVNYRAVTFKGL